MRRAAELLGILVLVALASQLFREPASVVERPVIPKSELNIHGIRLGDSLEQATELHGEPEDRGDGRYSWGRLSGAVVCADDNGIIYRIRGESLSRNDSTLLTTADWESKGISLLGCGEVQQVEVPGYCGFEAPTTRSLRRFESLYVESESRGFFWKERPKLSGFVLSDEELELTDCLFPLYNLVPTAPETPHTQQSPKSPAVAH